MTCEEYFEKESARFALARMLGIPPTADVSKQPEADLLILGSETYQAVLAREVDGEVTFDPFEAVGDYTVFFAKCGERTFYLVGYFSKDEVKGIPFWLLGRVPLKDLKG